MRFLQKAMLSAALCSISLWLTVTDAHAEMVLSKVIVDLQPDQPARDDIEVWNSGPERMYVAADPSVIHHPGLPDETREAHPDPEVTGLLVSPQRLVLEPGERRLIRISAIQARDQLERTYRVRIRPVTGPIEADRSAIKVLVGYDALVLLRPTSFAGKLVGTIDARRLTIRNDSNFAQEIFDGKQCDASGGSCVSLTAVRLYPGASLEQDLPYATPVSYKTTYGKQTVEVYFK